MIGYHSRKFNAHEKRYHTTEQECLAIIDSLEHFHVYLYGSHFTIITDHSALQWLGKSKERNNRLYRWSLKLSNYDYTIIHKPGKLNLVPDALSRAPVNFVKIFHASITFIQELQNALSVGEKSECTVDNGLYVTSDKKIFIPESTLPKLVEIYHDQINHPGQNKMTAFLIPLYYAKNLRQRIISYVQSCHLCQICKHNNRASSGTLCPIPTPEEPFKVISTDTIVLGHLARNSKHKYLQVFIDHHSRYVWHFQL